MAYKHFTSCFVFSLGGDKPYNDKDRTSFILNRLLRTAVLAGVLGVLGLLLGPIGALIAGTVGLMAGLTALIVEAADEWLNHRLICLSKDNPKCALGVVSYSPKSSEVLDFDNDQFFDVILMPHPTVAEGEDGALVAANRYNVDGSVVASFAAEVAKHPANDIFTDNLQGQTLLAARLDLEIGDLGYVALADNKESPHRTGLHCEAEGDFWVRMKQLAPALAALLTVGLAATAAGVAGGSTAGASIGCAILSWFLGPVGCAIGGFLGGLLGGAAGGAAVAAASYFGVIGPTLQAIAAANPGNVEDANVGDRRLGPISMGDHVAVLGEHVYDGYHEGWHEFHPLMAVM